MVGIALFATKPKREKKIEAFQGLRREARAMSNVELRISNLEGRASSAETGGQTRG